MSGRSIPGSEDAEYLSLVAALPPRPIRDKAQLSETQARIDELRANNPRTSRPRSWPIR